MSRKNTEIKELNPRDADAKYLGTEPKFTAETNSKWDLVRAFNWYNHFYDNKQAREFLAQYLEINGRVNEAKLIRRVNERNIAASYCWLARAALRGYRLSETDTTRLDQEINNLVTTLKPEDEVVEQAPSNRPNVQEIMRERTLAVGGELEGQWDDYIKSGAKKDSAIKAVDLLTQNNILPQHISLLTEAWQARLDEYELVLEGRDEQLNEAYERFGKIQLKNIISTCQTVLADLNSYVNIKKAGKKPRAKKPVPVEKVVRKLKYLKNFKLEKLELESVSPTKLHGCSEAWVYDTKKRKLHHYVADEYTKALGVKGNTVLGFCTKESGIKTLRKPEEQIKEIMGSKPAARKFFDNIKAVAATPNGRFNANMIILRAF